MGGLDGKPEESSGRVGRWAKRFLPIIEGAPFDLRTPPRTRRMLILKLLFLFEKPAVWQNFETASTPSPHGLPFPVVGTFDSRLDILPKSSYFSAEKENEKDGACDLSLYYL